MKKSWLIISLWLFVLIGLVNWTVRSYSFTPTFPYYEITSHYPRALSTLSNFDGVNYLRIATRGYPMIGGEVAFFPFYPVMIYALSRLGLDPFLAAIAISLSCLTLFLYLIHQLYPQLSTRFLLLFLSFPASFFLLSAYTESIFLLLYVLFAICLKSKRWWLAALVAALASATRLVGIIFGVILIIEYFRHHPPCPSVARKSEGGLTINHKPLAIFILSELGILAYMYYLSHVLGDPLAFIHVQPQFGMGRSGSEIILLPQVIFRYLRMILTVDPSSLLYWRVIWELFTFFAALFVLIKYWSKLTLSERLYSTWVVFLPTLSGTLSSFPRYSLVAIPLFLILAQNLKKLPFVLIVSVQTIILIINFILFTRGIFVA